MDLKSILGTLGMRLNYILNGILVHCTPLPPICQTGFKKNGTVLITSLEKYWFDIASTLS